MVGEIPQDSSTLRRCSDLDSIIAIFLNACSVAVCLICLASFGRNEVARQGPEEDGPETDPSQSKMRTLGCVPCALFAILLAVFLLDIHQ